MSTHNLNWQDLIDLSFFIKNNLLKYQCGALHAFATCRCLSPQHNRFIYKLLGQKGSPCHITFAWTINFVPDILLILDAVYSFCFPRPFPPAFKKDLKKNGTFLENGPPENNFMCVFQSQFWMFDSCLAKVSPFSFPPSQNQPIPTCIARDSKPLTNFIFFQN